MFNSKPDPIDAEPIEPPRVVGIVAKKQVVEIWHVHLVRTAYRERESELPPQVRTRTVNGRRERQQIYRRELARQLWGHFVIRRYQATRMLPWTPSLGLTMLIPGTLLAAGSANQGIMQVPVWVLIAQSVLIIVGGLLALSSGVRLLKRLRSTNGLPLESLGVSGHALGFPSGAVASDPAPGGYRAARYKGSLEIDIPVGEWQVVEEFTSDLGWRRLS
jgi:hypothetical protein